MRTAAGALGDEAAGRGGAGARTAAGAIGVAAGAKALRGPRGLPPNPPETAGGILGVEERWPVALGGPRVRASGRRVPLGVGVDTAPPETFGEGQETMTASVARRPPPIGRAVPRRGRPGAGDAPPHEMAPGSG